LLQPGRPWLWLQGQGGFEGRWGALHSLFGTVPAWRSRNCAYHLTDYERIIYGSHAASSLWQVVESMEALMEGVAK